MQKLVQLSCLLQTVFIVLEVHSLLSFSPQSAIVMASTKATHRVAMLSNPIKFHRSQGSATAPELLYVFRLSAYLQLLLDRIIRVVCHSLAGVLLNRSFSGWFVPGHSGSMSRSRVVICIVRTTHETWTSLNSNY